MAIPILTTWRKYFDKSPRAGVGSSCERDYPEQQKATASQCSMMKAKVAAVKAGEGLAEAVDTLVEHLGGWRSLVSSGETVVLKPNLVAPRRAQTGATTSLQLLAVLIDRLASLGVQAAILETPGMEYRLEETWRFFDLPAFARRHGASLLSVEDKDWVWLQVPGGTVLKRVRVHRAALEYPLFNVAKLKTHLITRATLSMKNLLGLCHDDTKRAMHIAGIHRAIVDLNRVVAPSLNIIDGTVGMEGDGAVYGLPRPLGMLLASRSALAADLVGLECMGFDLGTVLHLRRATETFGVPEIERVGETSRCWPFLMPRPAKAYLLAYRMLYVIDLWFHRWNGMHFNEFLYRKGIFGTRPYIVRHLCDACGICRERCPVPAAIELSTKKIDMTQCLRCLECVNCCTRQAIILKGMSGDRKERRQRGERALLG